MEDISLGKSVLLVQQVKFYFPFIGGGWDISLIIDKFLEILTRIYARWVQPFRIHCSSSWDRLLWVANAGSNDRSLSTWENWPVLPSLWYNSVFSFLQIWSISWASNVTAEATASGAPKCSQMFTSPMPSPLSDDLLNFLWDFLFSKKLFFPLSKARASEHCWTQENPPPTAPLPQRWYHLSLQRGRVLSDRVQGCSNLLLTQTMNSIRKSRPSPTSPSLPTSPAHPFSSTIIKLLMVHGCDFCVSLRPWSEAQRPLKWVLLSGTGFWESVFQLSVAS